MESSIKFLKSNGDYYFENKNIKIKFDDTMNLKVYHKYIDKELSLTTGSNNSHYIVINGSEIKNFKIDKDNIKLIKLRNHFGKGRRLILTGHSNGPSGSSVEKKLYIDMYKKFPEAALIDVEYKNVNSTPGLVIEKEVNNSFKLDASLINDEYKKYSFWMLHGSSHYNEPDWIHPITEELLFKNYQGQCPERLAQEDFGGGLPVLDIWCKETGFFIGSTREKPTPLSLPIYVDKEEYLNLSIEYNRENVQFNDVYRSIPVVIGVHHGDYYNGLRTYAKIMERKGLKMLPLNSSDPVYDAVWCGWGFGPDFTMKQMTDMIPLLKEYHFKVATVDLGWFYQNGDFSLRDDTFPNGDEDMIKFVKTFHDNGILMKLWITPCVAGPKLKKEHPEWLLRDINDKPMEFDTYGSNIGYLCPALKEVQDYYRELVRKFIGDWGYDGFKYDQSHINSISNCYAEDHQHAYPEESFEMLPDFYKLICDETLKLKPYAIIELCPCSMFPSFYKMPYYNQPIASDFKNQWHIRHRGKTIKALMGPHAAYYGDHAERHFKKSNFASMLGVGGIPGTMMVSRPEDNVEFLRVKYPCYLSPEREVLYKKWFDIYRNYQLTKGEYLNLYDIAYDIPETHVIKKDGILYYAFYAQKWNGEVEFRGLNNQNYTIIDYVNDKEIGKIIGNSQLKVQFNEYLLVKAMPD
jgi:alpha-galactosidase